LTAIVAPLPSLAEVYRRGRYAPYTRATRVGVDPAVALVRFAQPAGEYPDPPTADYTLALNERGAGRMWFDIGFGRRELAFVPGHLVLKPPGVATVFGADRPHQKSFVSLPAGMVDGILCDTGAERRGFDALHTGAFSAPPAARILDLLWNEADPDTAHGRLFAEGAVLALLGVLMGLASRGHPGCSRPGAMSALRVARVRDWVMAHLAEPFTLAQMAAVACLSPYHFSRSFKLATGLSPRAFAQACRIERARELLAHTPMPVAAVAQACGFSDQSHFTTSFVRAAGTTPGRFRRMQR
jgi:AraC family transcriptional regulator